MSWGPMSTFNFEQRMRDVSILHDALNNSPELKHFLRQQIFEAKSSFPERAKLLQKRSDVLDSLQKDAQTALAKRGSQNVQDLVSFQNSLIKQKHAVGLMPLRSNAQSYANLRESGKAYHNKVIQKYSWRIMGGALALVVSGTGIAKDISRAVEHAPLDYNDN